MYGSTLFMIHRHRLSFFFFSLLFNVLAQGLTDDQINIVKQRLQEGATHRSAYHSFPRPFRRQSAPLRLV